jgi:transcriptional regulator with XRE-family HTH domain
VSPMTLLETRKRKGLTQVQLAAKSGVDQTTISKIEVGTMQSPSWAIVAKLAYALRVRPEALFPVEVGK